MDNIDSAFTKRKASNGNIKEQIKLPLHVRSPSLPPIDPQIMRQMKRKENQRSLSQIVNDNNSIESVAMNIASGTGIAGSHNFSQESFANSSQEVIMSDKHQQQRLVEAENVNNISMSGSPYKIRLAKKPVKQIGIQNSKQVNGQSFPISPTGANKQFRGGILAPLHQTGGV